VASAFPCLFVSDGNSRVISINAKGERRSFSRSFTVPEDVDPEKIEAKVNDGMLVLTLARRPEAQPKRISVK